MGWQRGGNIHVNAANPLKSGQTFLAVWDPSLGDDLSVTLDREGQTKKNIPNSNLVKGHTAHVVVQ
jgi:hypothetical protein